MSHSVADHLDRQDDLAQVDEERHDAPFDIADIPQQLTTTDAHSQKDVHLALYQRDIGHDKKYIEQFKSINPEAVKLSTLRKQHDQASSRPAISLLKHRHHLVVDRRYLVNTGDSDVMPCVGPHYLDYTMYIGSRRGLDAALPKVRVDHNWTAKLTLNMTQRLWPTKNISALPFEPTGRMMYIGSRLDDQLWLAMVPTALFSRNNPDSARERLPILNGKTTAISTPHQIMLVMFIAHVLSTIPLEDMHSNEPYPDPLTWESVRDSTDIM